MGAFLQATCGLARSWQKARKQTSGRKTLPPYLYAAVPAKTSWCTLVDGSLACSEAQEFFPQEKVENCFVENRADTSKGSPVCSLKTLYYSAPQGPLECRCTAFMERLLP